MQSDPAATATGPIPRIHAPVRDDWLALVDEPLLLTGLPVIDAHHHLWDRPHHRYLADEHLRDLGTVPAVRATVYVQCRSSYHADGPEELRPTGEVRFARETAERVRHADPSGPEVCRAVVAAPDLTLGDRVDAVLDAMEEEAGGRLRGARNQTAWHADPAVTSSPFPSNADRLLDPAFQAGARRLARRDLSLDVWAYHSQLRQVRTLALACPDTTVVVDHMGGPLGVGPYAHTRAEVRAAWTRGMAELARLPNVRVKLSGAGLRVLGFRLDERPAPPDSAVLSSLLSPMVETCLDLFGPERCMFASNFPVDKGMFSYRVLWNAFARTTAALSRTEREHLFHRTADSVYRMGLAASAAVTPVSQEQPRD
ncbi:hypothetical protein SUDANB145_06368 [Streptomyces sp. enrichment culture]|uniref:amidohydrolase family protein n=1 Tax=Streptomyces sp. enrichment culture TaxID=1795815 RepID=UPI003F558C1E